MARQCRSIKRAMRRGHFVNLISGTYKPKKESKVMREIYEAALRKQNKKQEENGSTEG